MPFLIPRVLGFLREVHLGTAHFWSKLTLSFWSLHFYRFSHPLVHPIPPLPLRILVSLLSLNVKPHVLEFFFLWKISSIHYSCLHHGIRCLSHLLPPGPLTEFKTYLFGWTDWPESPGIHISISQSWRYRSVLHLAGNLKSDPHGCEASPLPPPQSSPSPCCRILDTFLSVCFVFAQGPSIQIYETVGHSCSNPQTLLTIVLDHSFLWNSVFNLPELNILVVIF